MADNGKQIDNKKQGYKAVLEYGSLILMIGFILYFVLGIKEAELARYPLSYHGGGDAMTGMVTAKSMLQNGWIYQNPYVGAPYDGTNYDAVTMELLLSLIEQCLVTLTGNWVLGFNLFYLAAYFLIGITALYTLRQLKIYPVIAVPSAVLYAFTPYHQVRGVSHLYLGMYFMVPLMVLYVYRLMKEEQLFQKGSGLFQKEKQSYLCVKNILKVLCLCCMALTGIYYAFFTCFFFCVVILYRILNLDDLSMRRKGWFGKGLRAILSNCFQPLFSIIVIVLTLIIAAIPNLIYWHQNGRGDSLMLKGKQGAELYGLKVIQLLLPIAGHRLTVFSKVRNFYDTVYPLVNENSSAALGVYMSIGFVILCAVLLVNQRLPRESNLRLGSICNITAVLFATIGGFSVILSFFTGAIRCHNRISIFIAMFSLIAVCEILQMIWIKWKKNILLVCMMAFLLYAGIYDQVRDPSSWTYGVDAALYEADDAFIHRIDDLEAEGAMIYQYPTMKYPENGGIQNMKDYAHFVGYLHSDHLRWSYGAVEGREGDAWQKALSTLSLREQIKTIQDAGFAGIYVDWNAYLPDERQAMEAILEKSVGEVSVKDNNGMRVYYSFEQSE